MLQDPLITREDDALRPEQNTEVAVRLRTLTPADGPRIVALDSGLTAEVELTPGASAAHYDRELRTALGALSAAGPLPTLSAGGSRARDDLR